MGVTEHFVRENVRIDATFFDQMRDYFLFFLFGVLILFTSYLIISWIRKRFNRKTTSFDADVPDICSIPIFLCAVVLSFALVWLFVSLSYVATNHNPTHWLLYFVDSNFVQYLSIFTCTSVLILPLAFFYEESFGLDWLPRNALPCWSRLLESVFITIILLVQLLGVSQLSRSILFETEQTWTIDWVSIAFPFIHWPGVLLSIVLPALGFRVMLLYAASTIKAWSVREEPLDRFTHTALDYLSQTRQSASQIPRIETEISLADWDWVHDVEIEPSDVVLPSTSNRINVLLYRNSLLEADVDQSVLTSVFIRWSRKFRDTIRSLRICTRRHTSTHKPVHSGTQPTQSTLESLSSQVKKSPFIRGLLGTLTPKTAPIPVIEEPVDPLVLHEQTHNNDPFAAFMSMFQGLIDTDSRVSLERRQPNSTPFKRLNFDDAPVHSSPATTILESVLRLSDTFTPQVVSKTIPLTSSKRESKTVTSTSTTRDDWNCQFALSPVRGTHLEPNQNTLQSNSTLLASNTAPSTPIMSLLKKTLSRGRLLFQSPSISLNHNNIESEQSTNSKQLEKAASFHVNELEKIVKKSDRTPQLSRARSVSEPPRFTLPMAFTVLETPSNGFAKQDQHRKQPLTIARHSELESEEIGSNSLSVHQVLAHRYPLLFGHANTPQSTLAHHTLVESKPEHSFNAPSQSFDHVEEADIVSRFAAPAPHPTASVAALSLQLAHLSRAVQIDDPFQFGSSTVPRRFGRMFQPCSQQTLSRLRTGVFNLFILCLFIVVLLLFAFMLTRSIARESLYFGNLITSTRTLHPVVSLMKGVWFLWTRLVKSTSSLWNSLFAQVATNNVDLSWWPHDICPVEPSLYVCAPADVMFKPVIDGWFFSATDWTVLTQRHFNVNRLSARAAWLLALFSRFVLGTSNPVLGPITLSLVIVTEMSSVLLFLVAFFLGASSLCRHIPYFRLRVLLLFSCAAVCVCTALPTMIHSLGMSSSVGALTIYHTSTPALTHLIALTFLSVCVAIVVGVVPFVLLFTSNLTLLCHKVRHNRLLIQLAQHFCSLSMQTLRYLSTQLPIVLKSLPWSYMLNRMLIVSKHTSFSLLVYLFKFARSALLFAWSQSVHFVTFARDLIVHYRRRHNVP